MGCVSSNKAVPEKNVQPSAHPNSPASPKSPKSTSDALSGASSPSVYDFLQALKMSPNTLSRPRVSKKYTHTVA